MSRVPAVRRNRGVDGCHSGCSSILYRLSFFSWGVSVDLRRCRSAIQLLELFIVFSRPGIVWDFFRFHCHITLNRSVVVRVQCIVVYLCGSIFIEKVS